MILIAEARFAISWQNALRLDCDQRMRRNYPYDEKMDGLSTGMRQLFSEKNFMGFEIEVNHSILESAKKCKQVARLLESTLKVALFTTGQGDK